LHQTLEINSKSLMMRCLSLIKSGPLSRFATPHVVSGQSEFQIATSITTKPFNLKKLRITQFQEL
jgi:hypothetical protein